ncbi:MAG: DUF996 domain-containing protein [Candidatus Bathyarchaeota archaeon]|nr:DUF996 domain-containing protein [Candidatus Bathyarchaeota archaeon]MDH5779844.1 DUF996 domain-containing protein [Candidatus Bathyarchaeota archaeon]
MDLDSSKALGGVGALLMVIGPFLGAYTGVLGLVGLILVMIALKGLSDHYSEEGIFNNALYGVILAIIGGVVSVAVIVMAAVDFLTAVGIDISTAWSDPTVFSSINWEQVVTWDILWPHIAAILGSLVVLFAFVVVASIFLRRSLTTLSARTGVNMFNTAGLLLLIGAVLTIILVGLVLMWIAFILLAVGFFSIKTPITEQPPVTPSSPS